MRALILAVGEGTRLRPLTRIDEIGGTWPLSGNGDRGSSGWKGQARMLLGIAISVACLVLLLWNIEWARFWSALEGADYWWLLPVFVAIGADLWIKVVKWHLLLLPAGNVSRTNLLYSMSVGYLVNTVLPGRLGELARTYMLAKMEGVSLVAVLSTVALDRILDVVAVALLLAVVLPSTDLPSWVGQSGLLVGAGGVGLLALCTLLAYPRWRSLLLRLLAASPTFPGKKLVEKWAEALCLGLEGLKGVGPLARVAAATAGIWIVTVLAAYLAQLVFHIQAPFWAAALVVAITNLGMVVPSSPGYVGVYHYLVVLALGAFGVERELALGYAVVFHLAWLLPVCLLGVFGLWRRGLTLMGWRDLGQSGQRP
ncbi:MAG: lysylphosphatidylglycerol synthase transmembrane domain-containing protein [Chloroflexota bacterium]